MATGKSAASSQNRRAEQKILRVGVIQAGKIVEERLVRRRENVTIGASPRNTIVVPASSLPRSFTLFELSGGQYHLIFGDSMDGRVSVDNQVMSLEQVKTSGKAQAKAGKGNLRRLALTEASRGKVLLGEITLLFQFVAPPPIQPRPQLPPSVRGGLVTNLDWNLTSSFLSVAVVNFAFLLYLKNVDIPRKVAVDALPDSFAEYIPEVEKPKPKLDVSKLAEKTGEKKAKKAKKVVKRKRAAARPARKRAPVKTCDDACQAARAAARRARLAKQVANLGALKLLGTKGAGTGATQNLIGRGDPGRKLDSALRGVSGVRAGGRSGRGLQGKGTGGKGSAAGIGDLGGRVGGPGKVGTGQAVAERVPRAIVKRKAPKIDGVLDKNTLNRELRRAARGVKMCYQRALKRNPDLSGKISVRIEISTLGRVTSVELETDTIGDSAVSACVEGLMKRQRFTPPKDGAAEVVIPFVFQAAN